jgi:hypothetical protein
MFTVYKFQRTGNGFKERLVIKGFKSSDAAHKFTNQGMNGNVWTHCQGPNAPHSKYDGMKAGTYAFAGGKFHNVKSLDVSVLAHI